MDLLEIRTKVRRKIDELSADFWTDDELNDYINDGYFYYWNWMLRAGHPGCETSAFLNIVQSVAEIPLPDGFVKARLVEFVLENVTIPLQYYPRFETANYTTGVPIGSVNSIIFTYDFIENNLILQPTSSESLVGGIKLTYIFTPDRLALDIDEPLSLFKNMFPDLLAGYAVIQAKEKEEMVGQGGADISSFLMSQQKREEMFKETIQIPTQQRMFIDPYGLGY